MPNLLANYSTTPPGHDEMLQAHGATKEAWEYLSTLNGLSSWQAAAGRRDDVVTLLADQGIRSGVNYSSPWRLDPLPFIVDAGEWAHLEAALTQRAMVLDALLADLYGSRRLLLDGVIPAEIVLGSPGFIRAADGTCMTGSHQLFHASSQIARTEHGWVAIQDSTDILPGLGYAMADRRAVADVLSGAYSSLSVRRLGGFFQQFRARLDAISPTPGDSARVVMLVPGRRAMTFDQAYLADTLGIPIVTPHDLIVADGRLWLRTLGDAEPVDVLLRHLPSIESDPVDLTSTAAGGVPGLIETAHSRSVSVANPIGAGVLENPALLSYLPQVCEHIFGEELILPSTTTYWCGDRSMGSHVIAHLENLVITDVSSSRVVNGWDLTSGERADLATQISAAPHLWVGQEPVEPSTSPSIGSEAVTATPTTIHTFAVAEEESYSVMPGGLGSTTTPWRRRSPSDIAKDVWVLPGEKPPAVIETAPPRVRGEILAAGAGANLFNFGTHLERAEGVLRRARNYGGDGDLTPHVSMEELSQSVAELVDAAHLVRDHLTAEAWRALAVLEQPASIAQQLVNITAITGVVQESIVRDRSWTLLMLGRRLERARFVLSTAIESIDNNEWSLPVPANSGAVISFLRLHDTLLSFRRHNQFRGAIPSLLELLLLSKRNPRSLAFCVEQVAELLEQLPSRTHAHTSPLGLVQDLRERFAEIASSERQIQRDDLRELLVDLSQRVSRLAGAIRTQQFGSLGTALWTAEVEANEVSDE